MIPTMWIEPSSVKPRGATKRYPAAHGRGVASYRDDMKGQRTHGSVVRSAVQVNFPYARLAPLSDSRPTAAHHRDDSSHTWAAPRGIAARQC